ncbi:hypothetical protein BESB_021110 [Besnoitia besnoiti]|uniref:Uncharacterized protein n=1 Tax=Besnoitia besnoiti TaxID=94643 RepID=A0A2A9M9W6_BESBE|nr:hypothetical protein BESB_021110 [Besnoitia besnoiti]PFH32170.1 hypothetical protein BESB_021110 [Besnoitia besnoiti]
MGIVCSGTQDQQSNAELAAMTAFYYLFLYGLLFPPGSQRQREGLAPTGQVSIYQQPIVDAKAIDHATGAIVGIAPRVDGTDPRALGLVRGRCATRNAANVTTTSQRGSYDVNLVHGSSASAEKSAGTDDQHPSPTMLLLPLAGALTARLARIPRTLPGPRENFSGQRRRLAASRPEDSDQRVTPLLPPMLPFSLPATQLHPYLEKKLHAHVSSGMSAEAGLMKAIAELARLRSSASAATHALLQYDPDYSEEAWVKDFTKFPSSSAPIAKKLLSGPKAFATWNAPPPTPAEDSAATSVRTSPRKTLQRRWPDSGLDSSLAAVMSEHPLPSGNSEWETAIKSRVTSAIEKEARRLAVILSMFSRNVAGRVVLGEAKRTFDNDVKTWWPSQAAFMNVETAEAAFVKQRDLEALKAAFLLGGPSVRSYYRYLVQMEAGAARELTQILKAERHREKLSMHPSVCRPLLEMNLRRLARETPKWADGPPRDLLLWFGEKHLRENRAAPGGMGTRRKPQKIRLPRGPGKRVLHRIDEDSGGEVESRSKGGTSAGQKRTKPPLPEWPMSLEEGINRVLGAFSCGEQEALRKCIPKFDDAVADAVRKHKGSIPQVMVNRVREEILIKLGDIIFSSILEESSSKWLRRPKRRSLKRGETSMPCEASAVPH